MRSGEYRDIIRVIARKAIRKHLKVDGRMLIAISDDIAKNVHARMYGANVDGVESPLWRDTVPTGLTASEILNKEDNSV